ncbi:MAG: alpha/beta hydrolase-fold protein [Bacteroidota bacterium]
MRSFLLGIALAVSACSTPNSLDKPTSNVSKGAIFSKSLKDSISYHLYFPAEYHEADTLPMLYLLHGHGGNDSTWVKYGQGNMQQILDSLISHQLIPPIMATTLDAGNTWYVDSHKKMETAFIEDFIPHIDSMFQSNMPHSCRIIAGNSAGGYGALRFTLKYPDFFIAAILLSPAAYYPAPPPNSSSRKINVYHRDSLFDVEVWKSYAHVNLISDYKSKSANPTLYISTGDDDEYGIVKVASELKSIMEEHQIPNELTVINGIHDWKVWNDRFCYDLVRVFRELEASSSIQ